MGSMGSVCVVQHGIQSMVKRFDQPLNFLVGVCCPTFGPFWGLNQQQLPSGKRLHNYGKSPFLMGKSTIYFYGHFQ